MVRRLLQRGDLQHRADFATREDRKANRLRLKAELETVLTTRPAAAWARDLNAIGVPAGAVLDVPTILRHEQVAERDFLAHFPTVPGLDRAIDLVRIGALIDGARPSVDGPPPALGQETDAVLADLGYDAAEIERLHLEGVV